MEKIPEGLQLCNLEVIIMPNGEILCKGKTFGVFREFKDVLSVRESVVYKDELLRLSKRIEHNKGEGKSYEPQ